MEEKKSPVSEVAPTMYYNSEKPFDFISESCGTALVCDSNPVIKEKIIKELTKIGYAVEEPSSSPDALDSLRFHTYDLIVINEKFSMANAQDSNEVLIYLQNLGVSTRRNIFVVLLTDKFRTMDNMIAFNKSVNLVINNSSVDKFEIILKRALDDHKYFYGVFKESLKKMGRV